MSKPKKKKSKDLARGNAIAEYLFILPFIIGFFLFLLYPLAQSFYYSFSEVELLAGEGVKCTWAGLKHFKWMFTEDPDFPRLLVGELQKMALYVPAILVFCFFMAMLFTQACKVVNFDRAV